PSTSTPVAIGSRVPAWPTLRVPARRRTRATTSCDVIPPGLSTTTSPDAGSAIRVGGGDRAEALGERLPRGVVCAGLLVGIRLTGVRRPALGRRLLVEGPGPGQHLVDLAGVLRDRIGNEGQARSVPHAELL